MKTDRFQNTVSRKFNWNEGLNTVGSTLSSIFKKPDTNITYIEKEKEGDKDNTILYVGVGGVVLLVVLLIVMLK